MSRIVHLLSITSVSPNQGWAGIPVPDHSREYRPPIPVPKVWEWVFHSRSQKLGMLFSIPVPIPKIWESNFRFPFDTNECPNIYSRPIYSNIWMYSSHSDVCLPIAVTVLKPLCFSISRFTAFSLEGGCSWLREGVIFFRTQSLTATHSPTIYIFHER